MCKINILSIKYRINTMKKIRLSKEPIINIVILYSSQNFLTIHDILIMYSIELNGFKMSLHQKIIVITIKILFFTHLFVQLNGI